MSVSRRSFLRLGGAATVGAALPAWSLDGVIAKPAAGARQLATNDPILHLVNRLTWGARPADVARARQIGYEAYLNEQLNPDTINDAPGDDVLQRYPIITMNRRTLYQLNQPAVGRAATQMISGMVERAVYSERQLHERMVDFWADHFNVSLSLEETYVLEQMVFQNEVLREHALGKFRDILIASAKSPAMLIYLDNFINIAEDPNENYSRELMELHTLGVDGGYTEQDVVEVARAFTGWTIHNGTPDGFWFDTTNHDTGPKVVLGHHLPGGRGIEDGLHVLSILANHPSTARFLSRKLCVRFVSDNPPQALIDSTTQVWQQSDGDIRTVLRHIFTSRTFRESAGMKFRRPLEWFIGALRATGTTFNPQEQYYRIELLQRLSQVPYGWLPPNGYPDIAEAWLSTNNLLQRWNIAMTLTHDASNGHHGIRVNLFDGIDQPQTALELVDTVATQVFGTTLPADMAAPFITYVAESSDPNQPISASTLSQKLATLFGLMLASPLYQWR